MNTFIGLGDAMQDEAYTRPDTFAGPGGSWLSRSATVMDHARPVVPKWITELSN